jgi:PadR family transcriptional regulator PadR
MGSSMADQLEILRGTLDVLILKSLSFGPRHGYAVAEWLEQSTGDLLRVGEGSLYPALHRLQERGWVRSSWGLSDNNRRARYYELTAKGRRQLRTETVFWARFAETVSAVLAQTAEAVKAPS